MSVALKWPKLPPATEPVKLKEKTRCLVVKGDSVFHSTVFSIGEFLNKEDLLVVNDAATLPALLKAETESGDFVEVRLIRSIKAPNRWWALVLGAGSWRIPTEQRVDVPLLRENDLLIFNDSFRARVVGSLFDSNRLIEIVFEGENLWNQLYRHARPIQYSYLSRDLELWDPQTIFAGPPVAFEAPSAAFCLTWSLLEKLKSRGISLVSLTHSTGISSTGEERLDRLFPLPETCVISSPTVEAIKSTKRRGGRVIAVGTGTVRALEGVRPLRPGEFEVSLRINESLRPLIVDGIITGLHESRSSHLELLSAFARPEVLRRAYSEAQRLGYKIHEFGDVNLIVDKPGEK
jgi:S-adenosylmethionine:tRNA ribosyltransferase-isomerase